LEQSFELQCFTKVFVGAWHRQETHENCSEVHFDQIDWALKKSEQTAHFWQFTTNVHRDAHFCDFPKIQNTTFFSRFTKFALSAPKN